MNGNDIKIVAQSFIGQTEIKGNQGFTNPRFLSIMESVGWVIGHAWCSYFGEAVWTLSVKDDKKTLKILDKCFSGSAIRTLQKFEEAGYQRTSKPKVGALAIWRGRKNGVQKSTGHVGIVVEVHSDYFVSIEGNTNQNGVREGGLVALRQRKYSFHIHSGLELQGFINPIDSSESDSSEDELPFKNKTQGNKFRAWFNDNYPEESKEIDLDRKGSYNNSYILKAYEISRSVYIQK